MTKAVMKFISDKYLNVPREKILIPSIYKISENDFNNIFYC